MTVTFIELSGTIDAAGNGRLTVKPRNRQNWTVQQVSVNAPDVGGSASCAVYRNDTLITPMVAQQDSADGNPYIPVPNGYTMSVRWIGGIPGAPISAAFFYDDGEA